MVSGRTLAVALLSTVTHVRTASSYDRARAFERVYDEGRWLHSNDGALCASGWSNVAAGQGAAALRAVLKTIQTFGIRSIADIPSGDGCFAGSLLDAMRNQTELASVEYVGVDIVGALVQRNEKR